MKLTEGWSKETFQKIFIVGMFTLSALYGTMQYYVMRQKGLLKEWESKSAVLADQIAEAEKMAQTAEKEKAQREKLEAFVAEHRKAMITGDPFAWVVRELTLLAEKHPVRVQSLRPGSIGEVAQKNRYSTFSIEVSLAGQYDQIGNFVADLENHFASGKIKSLSMPGSPSGDHRAVLELVLLIVPEPKTIGPVKDGAAASKEAS